MRADNTSVVTLMLDPPGPPRATVLRSRSSATRPTPAAPPAPTRPDEPRADEPEPRPVPQNGLTIMTRYSDGERAAPPPAPPDVPLPPCATLDTRLPPAPALDETPRETPDPDDDAIANYGNPAESYFMARLLNRTRVINTLSAVHEEIAGAPAPREPSEPREPTPAPATVVLDVDTETDASTANRAPLPPRSATGEPATASVESTNLLDDDGGIQINEVSSSSPTEGPPKPRGRRPRADAKRDPPAAAPDRVLRSHHDADPPQRPHTRQATRGRPPAASPAPPLDRVVILTRRAPPVPSPAPPPPPRTDRLAAGDVKPSGRRVAPAPAPVEPIPVDEDVKRSGTRSTRSQGAQGVTPLAQKITRSIGLYARELRGAAAAAAAAAGARAGNSARAPGPARRTPAARRPPPDRSKENLGAARGRARARAVPVASPPPPSPPPGQTEPPRPRTRRADSAREDPEVHSTTAEPPPPSACAGAPAPTPSRPRALRSRNDASEPVRAVRDQGACKRTRCGDDGGGGASKAARLAPERCARALGKRATGPWAPALALRNRLRRRLAK